jgi:hypothetical protein
MTYGPAQKCATYRYRDKIRQTAAFKAKVRLYNAANYASLVENKTKLALRCVKAKWVHYYATDCLRDVRRLFT